MKNFDKVLDLVNKTGDKVIVVSEKYEPYILMTFKEYNSILKSFSSINKLSEEELLNKINRDIAIWKSSQDDEYKIEDKAKEYNLEDFKVEGDNKKEIKKSSLIKEENNSEEEDKYYIEPVD